jgi:hypothetical protein
MPQIYETSLKKKKKTLWVACISFKINQSTRAGYVLVGQQLPYMIDSSGTVRTPSYKCLSGVWESSLSNVHYYKIKVG